MCIKHHDLPALTPLPSVPADRDSDSGHTAERREEEAEPSADGHHRRKSLSLVAAATLTPDPNLR
jgi:hypothetical protein